MANLPVRRKVAVYLWRRAGPDEVLLREKVAKGKPQWAPLTEELQDHEPWDAAAQRAAAAVGAAAPLQVTDLGLKDEYAVKAGPAKGAWQERAFALEVPPGTPARDGRWLPHYDAKQLVGTPKGREAITVLRTRLGLKP